MIRPTLRRFADKFPDQFNALVSRRVFERTPTSSGVLGGTTFAAKDNIATVLEPTTCGSEILRDYQSPFEATVITQLEAAGSALIGKTNMDEFGMGSSTTFSIHGPTINPKFVEKRIAGGSSGGSAAAVASGLADYALGTDTGGSVRQPASYCGIVGFKPSYGRVSRYGVVAYAQGLDCVGVFTKKIDLMKKVFKVIDQYDERDITSMHRSTRDKISKRASDREAGRKLRIGIPQEFLLEELEPASLKMLESLLNEFIKLGHSVHPVSVPSIHKSLAAYYTLASAEAASNLSRYDGIRYGTNFSNLRKGISKVENHGQANGQKLITASRTKSFGPEAQRRIILGNYTLSSESGDNYFRATQLRKRIVSEFNEIFEHPNFLWESPKITNGGCDVIVGPTAFGKPPTFEEFEKQQEDTFLNEYLNDIFTVPASLAGLPAISVPYRGGDCGIQVMGQYGDDATVLQVGEMIENL